MTDTLYIEGLAPPAGLLEGPGLHQYAVGLDTPVFRLIVPRDRCYMLRARPSDPSGVEPLVGPPFVAGMLPSDEDAFAVDFAGARTIIYPAGSFGITTRPDDVPPNLYIPGKMGPVNYEVSLFSGIEPVPSAAGGFGVIQLIDPNGELDYLVGLAFDGAPLDILAGDHHALRSSWGLVAQLTTAGLFYTQRGKEIRLRDLGWQLEQAELHGQRYGGTGGADGDASIAGVMKPYAIGPCFNAEPVQVNAALLIYQVSFTPIEGVDDVKDGTLSIDFAADYPTYGALAAATVASATYATCLAEGLIRLGSSVVFSLTVDLRGDANDIGNIAYPRTRAQIARRIATGYGDLSLTDDQIDFDAINLMEQEQAAVAGFYFRDATTKAEALTRVMTGCLGWWIVRTDGLLALGYMAEPTGDAALVIEYPQNFGSSEPEQVQAYVAPRRATLVGWQHNYTILDASRVAGGADEATRLLYALESRFSSTSDSSIASIWPTSQVVYNVGDFWSEDDATAESLRQQNLMGVRRERWRVSVVCDPFANILGRVVQINGFTRYGWNGSRKFICVGMAFASGRSVMLDLWG